MNGEQLYADNGERALIGAAMINPAIIPSLSVTPADFYVHKNRFIFQAILDLHAKGIEPDFVTVGTELDKRGQLAEIGGPAALTSYLTGDMSSMNAAGYAAAIKDRAARRRVMAIAQEVAQAMLTGADVGEAASQAAAELAGITANGKEAAHWGAFLDAAYTFAEERAKNPGETWGIPTGLIDYDRATGGLQPSELVILSGEPGIGKSFLTLQMAIGLAASKPGALYSLEMLGRSVGLRALSIESGIPSSKTKAGKMADSDWPLYVQTYETLSQLPIHASDAEGWSLAEIRADLLRLKARHGVGWFIVDYSYMLADGAGLSDNERTMMISAGMKRICKASGMAGILIHSMNKTGMADKTGGSQAGLRGSAQLAYDADIILMITNADELNNIVTVWFKKGRELENDKKMFQLKRVGAKFHPVEKRSVFP